MTVRSSLAFFECGISPMGTSLGRETFRGILVSALSLPRNSTVQANRTMSEYT